MHALGESSPEEVVEMFSELKSGAMYSLYIADAASDPLKPEGGLIFRLPNGKWVTIWGISS